VPAQTVIISAAATLQIAAVASAATLAELTPVTVIADNAGILEGSTPQIATALNAPCTGEL
jgi:hypothetical protein